MGEIVWTRFYHLSDNGLTRPNSQNQTRTWSPITNYVPVYVVLVLTIQVTHPKSRETERDGPYKIQTEGGVRSGAHLRHSSSVLRYDYSY